MATSQSVAALTRANECKALRFELAKQVRAGETRLSELLRQPNLPDWLEGERVSRLLRQIPHFGKTRVNTLLADLHIGQLRPVGELTYRQRRQLSEELATEEGRGYRPSRRRARLHRVQTALGTAGGRVEPDRSAE